MKLRLSLTVFAVAIGSFFLGAWAQDDKGGAAMQMPAWMAKTQHHKDMLKSCGDFTVDGNMWMVPGAEPMGFTGTSTRKMILNGYFLQEDMKGESMGVPYNGRLIQGYDTITKEFVSIWMDDHGPYITITRGQEKDGAITLTGQMPDMMTGKLKDTRSVVESDEMGQITYSSYDVPKEGDARLTMKISYKRAAKKADAGK